MHHRHKLISYTCAAPTKIYYIHIFLVAVALATLPGSEDGGTPTTKTRVEFLFLNTSGKMCPVAVQ